MPRIEGGVVYLNGGEVMDLWPASRNLFYGSIQPRLQSYHFDGKKRPHFYKESEVLALKSGKPTIQKEPITISGIFSDWTIYLRSLGYQADTINNAIETVTLPEEASNTFHIPPERRFAKRSRKTLANGVPICTWSTYYPFELVEGDILNKMKQDPTLDVVKQIREIHGIAVGWERNRYTSRNTTLEEQETLQLLTNEPVLILQRGCWTNDRQILTHISHMTLLGSWFAIEHSFPVNTWNNQQQKEEAI
jgi:DNA-binding GntR family transcriptional regulator